MLWQWADERAPNGPAANMAVDEGLLDDLVSGTRTMPVVRLYRWDRPAVTVGRLQSWDAVAAAFPGVMLVRRPTGGRAVEHGNDLAITVATREEWLPGIDRGVMPSYRLIAGALIDAYARAGVPAEFGRQDHAAGRSVDCFAGAARCDIVDRRTGQKLMGAAQRRVDGVILQQMSLPAAHIGDVAQFTAALRGTFTAAFQVSEWVEDTEVRVDQINSTSVRL